MGFFNAILMISEVFFHLGKLGRVAWPSSFLECRGATRKDYLLSVHQFRQPYLT